MLIFEVALGIILAKIVILIVGFLLKELHEKINS